LASSTRLHDLRGEDVRTIRIPPELADAVAEDDYPERLQWLAALPAVVDQIASDWELELGDPYLPGGQCAWVAPARDPAGQELALKVGWRHREAEHEAEALRFWEGDGAVRCFASRSMDDSNALLLERCVPGLQLKRCVPEREQDSVIAELLRRLWARRPADGHPFGSLRDMCEQWAESVELTLELDDRGTDPGLARAGATMLRELSRTTKHSVLLCTDLHAENVLAAQREPWLMIDPKPFVGDPAFDPVQHMLNCDQRLAADPAGLADRMAELCQVEPERVKLWLFARCAQESTHYPTLRDPALRLAP
jgi:streptomycin 6-kinase